MLQSLYLKNIAIFDEVSVTFDAGFQVLTGETGAGKSILIDAVNLVLGGKASRGLIRSGEKSALVSAVFLLPEALKNELKEEYPQAEDGELCISREITKEGRNVCKIGARPVPASVLKEIGLKLINIHGQSDNLSLYRREVHIEYLDRFCPFEKALAAYQEQYRTYRALEKKVLSLEMQTGEEARRAEELSFQSEELAAAALQEGEEESLREKKRLYTGREKLQKAGYAVYAALYEMPEGTSVYDLLKGAHREISAVEADSETAQEIAGRLEEFSVLAQDLAAEARDLAEEGGFSPEEIEQMEERLDLISRLKRKYGKTVEELIAYQKQIDEELFSLLHREQALEKVRSELKSCRRALLDAGAAVTKIRRETAQNLEGRIASELRQLDMPGVQFQIQIDTPQGDAARFSENGMDTVEFLIAPNAGEGLLPISKIASGGEMARIMLAIKSVMASVETVETLIFDEIDTGVSGRAAQKIAQKMAQLSQTKQVMAVTHLPQIASMADRQYQISKSTAVGRTSAEILPLDEAGRIREIARMTGGVSITEKTLESAREMLDLAKRYRAQTAQNER